MIERKHRALATSLVLLDAFASMGAMLAAWYLRFAVEVIPVTKGPQSVGVYTDILPLVALVFPLVFAFQGLYRTRPARTFTEETVGVAIATVIGTVILSGLLLWARPGDPGVLYSRATLLIFVACEIGFVTAARAVLRGVIRRRYRSGKNLERVAIVGGGEIARAVAERIGAHQELGFELAGYLSSEGEEFEGMRRLGGLDDLGAVIEREKIDHVYVALPQSSGGEMMALLDRLIRECVSIHVVPDLLQFMALRSRVEDLDGLPTVNLTETALDGWKRAAKRLFDVALSSVALVFLSPLFGLIALAIRLEDGGSIFYRQVRMGLDGIPFEMLKFRSMRADAERESGPVFASRDDERRTRIGRLIRAWSLDELPQLWNVLRGDMSVVGPRPERPEFVRRFREEFPHYMLRHKVRSGITGWAQVHGWRGNTSIQMRIEHDLYYIENWSFGLDVRILFMTILHGFRNENAY
jgi:exopolysaccharide biosynthesis polyprenyl glycosylphosphotransferase